jgi:hypothetical protein
MSSATKKQAAEAQAPAPKFVPGRDLAAAAQDFEFPTSMNPWTLADGSETRAEFNIANVAGSDRVRFLSIDFQASFEGGEWLDKLIAERQEEVSQEIRANLAKAEAQFWKTNQVAIDARRLEKSLAGLTEQHMSALTEIDRLQASLLAGEDSAIVLRQLLAQRQMVDGIAASLNGLRSASHDKSAAAGLELEILRRTHIGSSANLARMEIRAKLQELFRAAAPHLAELVKLDGILEFANAKLTAPPFQRLAS